MSGEPPLPQLTLKDLVFDWGLGKSFDRSIARIKRRTTTQERWDVRRAKRKARRVRQIIQREYSASLPLEV